MRGVQRDQLKNCRRQRDAGQSMVELALVLPLFLTMVLAVVEIGRAFAAKQSLTIASREGARVLVLPYGAGLRYTTEAALQSAATDRVRSYLSSSGVGIGPETVVRLARIQAGNDGAYGSSDDPPPEFDYTQGVRGQRVGVVIEHRFETPLPFMVQMFESPDSATSGGSAVATGSSIRMVKSSYMVHE